MDLLDVLVGCATLKGMTSTILVTQHIDLDASAYSVRVRGVVEVTSECEMRFQDPLLVLY